MSFAIFLTHVLAESWINQACLGRVIACGETYSYPLHPSLRSAGTFTYILKEPSLQTQWDKLLCLRYMNLHKKK